MDETAENKWTWGAQLQWIHSVHEYPDDADVQCNPYTVLGLRESGRRGDKNIYYPENQDVSSKIASPGLDREAAPMKLQQCDCLKKT